MGGSSTPIHNADAVAKYNAGEYPFALLKCPCCGARFGLHEGGLLGVQQEGMEIIFRCYNPGCESRDGYQERSLPIYVVNDQIYMHNPTILVGTVDMFAQIPWKTTDGDGNELLSRIFGFRGNNTRMKPPELIIQDELHLISGPLGSMVGMYETLVQELCTDHGRRTYPFIPQNGDDAPPIPPKIVASSATISRAADQIRGLYGKARANALQIFPPQGADIGETWFSTVDRVTLPEHPHLHQRGRWYAGMCPAASGHSTVYRSYGAVLAAHHATRPDAGDNNAFKAWDHYGTLVGFYNSTKELGRANTMMVPGGNLPTYLHSLARRQLVPDLEQWQPVSTELYSLVDAGDINVRLKRLERSLPRNIEDGADDQQHADICLATNMIATGLDVPRLGLMFIHGQPKTTAEYIQASSRVGRSIHTGPGLVFTHYSGVKPRDASIFEHFSSYHERIYAQVEPTSVTSWSIRVREKALHAIILGLVRHYSKNRRHQLGPIEVELKSYIRKLLLDRAQQVMGEEVDLSGWIDEFLEAVERFTYYGDMSNNTLRQAIRWPKTAMMNASKPKEITEWPRFHCLPTPATMRSVDSNSKLTIRDI